MSKSKFNLKAPSSEKVTPILLKMHVGEKTPVVISIKESIFPKKWNFNTQRSKGRTAKDKRLNDYIDSIEEISTEVYRNFKKNGIKVKNKSLKLAILERLGENSNNKFYDFIDKIYAQKTGKGQQVKSYLSTKKILQKFNDNLSFDDITINFYHDFVNYLFQEGYSKNYIGVIIKNIKVFMNDSFEEKPPLHKNLDFKRKDFKKPSAPTFTIPLHPADIQKIYKAKLPEHLEVSRDYFILACDTGVRFQNWQDINSFNIKDQEGIKLLIINTDKTNTNICVFMSSRSLEILKKHGGQLPPKKSNKDVNKNLKEIGLLAGLDRKVKRIIERKEKETEYTELYKCISTHTARTSFITYLKSKGIQDSDIMKMTGQKSSQTLSIYDKESNIQNAIKTSKKVKINHYIAKVN